MCGLRVRRILHQSAARALLLPECALLTLCVRLLPQELKERHRAVMQGMLMDVLRALSAPNMDIRKKTLDIALDLITQHNIDEARPVFSALHQTAPVQGH